MTFSGFKLVLAAVAVGIVVLGSVWLYGQPRGGNSGTFGPTGVEPAYIVVNTPTAVLFTSQITDRQLKKRSVILVRLDGSGKPSEVLGRLHDDGEAGDLKANDSIYSLRTTLTESTVGSVVFRIAARFKPGRWIEPESDDDDWDKELSLVRQMVRDRPAQRERLARLLSKLDKYTLSESIALGVWNQLQDTRSGLKLNIPPLPATTTWSVEESDGHRFVDVKTFHPDSNQYMTVFRILLHDNPQAYSLLAWFHDSIDATGVLVSTSVYLERNFPTGVIALIRSAPLPDSFLDTGGPVGSVFAAAPGTTIVFEIVQSHDVTLGDFGYSRAAVEQLFNDIAGNISK